MDDAHATVSMLIADRCMFVVSSAVPSPFAASRSARRPIHPPAADHAHTTHSNSAYDTPSTCCALDDYYLQPRLRSRRSADSAARDRMSNATAAARELKSNRLHLSRICLPRLACLRRSARFDVALVFRCPLMLLHLCFSLSSSLLSAREIEKCCKDEGSQGKESRRSIQTGTQSMETRKSTRYTHQRTTATRQTRHRVRTTIDSDYSVRKQK